MKIDLTNIQINPYRLLPLAVIFWPAGNAIADHAISQLRPSTSEAVGTATSQTYLDVGDFVAGYEVSSGYDLERVHPVRGTVEPHYGVDVAMPTGT
ncbi:MAG: hypothetical protein AAFP03_19330, partial [Cyanobacteria bacterium J06598_3]